LFDSMRGVYWDTLTIACSATRMVQLVRCLLLARVCLHRTRLF
jgi:hypothetical protein